MPIAEGKLFKWVDETHIRTELLETFPFEWDTQLIEIVTPEFSAVCPFSGLPDIGTVIITYKPTGKCCIELKSLKYYFISFRNVGIYQEAVTTRIYLDLAIILNTIELKVVTKYNTRGGMDVTCSEGSIT
ncbi:MAG: preQ(1) synthase [Bacteroidetes bacterium]|nr:preQ(1) synthase [Bacteroidota bacterium]